MDCRVCRYQLRPGRLSSFLATISSCPSLGAPPVPTPSAPPSRLASHVSLTPPLVLTQTLKMTRLRMEEIRIRRARTDELEGLLADSGEDNYDGDSTADADAISLHSHLGPRGRRKPPPKKPRHISVFGFDLFAIGRRVKLPEEGTEPLYRFMRTRGCTGVNDAEGAADGHSRRTRNSSTEALLSHSSPEAEVLNEVSKGDVEHRARRKARKEMRRSAAQLAEQESVVPPAPSPNAHGGISAVFLPPLPSPLNAPPPALVNQVNEDEEDEADADLDGGMYAKLAPRGSTGGSRSTGLSRSSGRSSGSGSGVSPYRGVDTHAPPPFTPAPVKPKRLKRSKRSKSSATSSTLASLSPPPGATSPEFPQFAAHFKLGGAAHGEEFAAFARAERQEEFDGTPGGFGFGVPERLEGFEALTSPGLGRPRGFSASSKGGNNTFLTGF